MGAMFGCRPSEMLRAQPFTFAVDSAGYRHAREQQLEDLESLAKSLWGG